MFWIFWTYTPVKDRFQAQNRNDCSVIMCRAGVRVNFWTFGLFVYTRTNNSELIQKCNSTRNRRARKLKQTCEPNRSKFNRFQRHKIIFFLWREFELLDKIERPSSKNFTSDNWRSNRDSLLDKGHRYFLRWEALSLSLICAESSLSTNVQRTLRKRSYRSRITPHFCNALSTSYNNLTSDMGFFSLF